MPITNNRADFHRIENVMLSGMLAEFRDALRDEIKEIEKSGLSSIILKEGHRLYTSSGYWYQFKIEYLPNIPEETPCKLTIGNENHDVTVIGFDDNYLTIEAKEELPNTIAEAKLENGTAVLLEILIKRIEHNSIKDNPAGQRMMHASEEGTMVVDADNIIAFQDNLSYAQKKAITSAVCNNITFIWGPPGTGKTTVIAHVITELLNRDRSVLLVSHTNSAVNGAIKKVDKEYYSKNGETKNKQYPILRLGAGGRDELEDRLQIETQIELASRDLVIEKEKLEKEFDEIQKSVVNLKKVVKEFNWVNNTHLDSIKAILNTYFGIEQSIETKNRQFASIQQDINIQIASHPEYREAKDLKKIIKEAENEITQLNASIRSIIIENAALSQKMQTAKDEVAKYEQYTELKQKEARYYTENTLKNKIEDCKRKSAFQEDRIAKNNGLIGKAELIIKHYEGKGSIGKFFSSKRDYEQAIATISRLNTQNEEIQRELQATRLSQNEYDTQLVELLSIKNRLAEIQTSRTRIAWEDEYESCNSKIAQLLSKYKDTTNKRNKAIDTKSKADARLHEIQVVCISIDSLLANLETVKAKLDSLQKRTIDLRNEFSKLIAEERGLCLDMYSFYDGFESFDIAGLEIALEQVKKDIEGKDINSTQVEIKSLVSKQQLIGVKLDEIDNKIARIAMLVIKQAKVIGTTLAKSYLSDEIQNRTFDTIILDEASMAPIPALWCASQVAEKNIVIVGDFLQLPPIVIAETDMAKKWLGRDIFEVSGAQELFRTGNQRPPCVMLNQQFRMKKEIADVVNTLYYRGYGGLLSDDRCKPISDRESLFKEWYNTDFEKGLYSSYRKEKSIHLLDTQSLNAWVTSVPSGKNKSSRLNAFSAVLSVELAFKLLENYNKPAENPKVLIIAPYKAHVKRIEQLIIDKYYSLGYTDKTFMKLINVGTIHSFQGKEADIVIFDLVIDEPHWRANLFMPDKEINLELQKMFNVAISRARFKLFIVGNFNYCTKKAKSNALGKLLKYLVSTKKYPLLDAKTYFPNMTYSRPSSRQIPNSKYMMEVCLEDVFLTKLKSDIQLAKKKIIIYSPFMTEKAISPLLPFLKDSVNRGCLIVVITKTIDEVSDTKTQKQECELQLIRTGIQVIHKKGMHEKIIIIDDDIVWIGSLNVLSFGGTTKEVMCKIISEEGAREFAEIFDIDYILEATNYVDELKCPLCGKDMIMAESDTAGFYWRCSDKDGCGWSRRPEEQYPRDGKLVCPKCGGAYSFTMKNEPRWVCENQHYRMVRKTDLRLNKMRELIPNDIINHVETYINTRNRKQEVGNTFSSIQNPKRKKQIDNGQLSLF